MPGPTKRSLRARAVPAVYRAVRPTPPGTRSAEVNATPQAIRLVLPLPPSKNRLTKRIGVKGGGYREVPTAEREEFLRSVGYLGLGLKPFTGPVSVRLRIYRARSWGDAHNFEELLFDALQGIGYLNDAQVQHHECWCDDDTDNPRVEVSIEPLS